jgi:hypothetical protein
MYTQETKAKLLAAMPGTREELQVKSGLANSTIRAVTKALLLAGECHIGDWQRGAGHKPRGVYQRGPGNKAKVPRFFDRPKAQRTGVWRDPLVAALFGEATKC